MICHDGVSIGKGMAYDRDMRGVTEHEVMFVYAYVQTRCLLECNEYLRRILLLANICGTMQAPECEYGAHMTRSRRFASGHCSIRGRMERLVVQR
jgi:hypothetical protein